MWDETYKNIYLGQHANKREEREQKSNKQMWKMNPTILTESQIRLQGIEREFQITNEIGRSRQAIKAENHNRLDGRLRKKIQELHWGQEIYQDRRRQIVMLWC